MGSAVSEGERGSPFSWLQELPVSACAGNQMNTAYWVAWFALQKLDFGVTPGLWVPTLPSKPVSRLPADLFTSRVWVRDSSKIIVQSPWLSGVKREQTISQSRQQSWCNVSFAERYWCGKMSAVPADGAVLLGLVTWWWAHLMLQPPQEDLLFQGSSRCSQVHNGS